MEKGICVCIKALVLQNNGAMLAIRRTETAPTNPLKWDIPGGVLEWGEDPASGIIREIKEEAGIDIKDIRTFGTFSEIHRDGKHGVTIFYSAHAISAIVSLSFEHDKFQWVMPGEFLQLDATKKSKRAVKLFLKLNQ